MARKERNDLVVNNTQQKFAKSLARVSLNSSRDNRRLFQAPHTFREDGTLHYGDYVLLRSGQTGGVLVFDMSDRITTHDEAYAVTATKDIGACARSIVQIMPHKGSQFGEAKGPICFGQEIRIVANP